MARPGPAATLAPAPGFLSGPGKKKQEGPKTLIDVKLKLQPGHAGDLDWTAPSPLWQLFWNVTYACNFRCAICFSNAGRRASDELTTQEAKQMIRTARAARVTNIIISGGEPFARVDLIELLMMTELGITARIPCGARRARPRPPDTSMGGRPRIRCPRGRPDPAGGQPTDDLCPWWELEWHRLLRLRFMLEPSGPVGEALH